MSHKCRLSAMRELLEKMRSRGMIFSTSRMAGGNFEHVQMYARSKCDWLGINYSPQCRMKKLRVTCESHLTYTPQKCMIECKMRARISLATMRACRNACTGFRRFHTTEATFDRCVMFSRTMSCIIVGFSIWVSHGDHPRVFFPTISCLYIA